MGRHFKNEHPKKPNTLLDLAASAVPDGVEVAVIVRLEDSSFKLSRIYSMEEFDYMLEGLDLCAKTAAYQKRPFPRPEATPVPPAPPPGSAAPESPLPPR